MLLQLKDEAEIVIVISAEDVEKEKRSGILCLEAYSDKDWEKYGDNIALENTTSDLWNEWITENWEEELYRRRINYTLPYYETEGKVCWLQDLNWPGAMVIVSRLETLPMDALRRLYWASLEKAKNDEEWSYFLKEVFGYLDCRG